MPLTYYSVTTVKFDASGNIIFKTGSSSIPAQSGSDNSKWSDASSKTIYELQKTAFSDLNTILADNTSQIDTDLPGSMQTYFNALDKIIDYNTNANNTTSRIVFYDQRNGGVDYAAYEKLVKTRDSIKAKMDYINSVQGTLSHEQNMMYANGIYMNTLVAILATSLLYLVFVHLR